MYALNGDAVHQTTLTLIVVKRIDNLIGDDVSLKQLKSLLPTYANPFFLEESVRLLVETNVIAGEPGNYRVIGPLREVRIPATVQVILAARIDRLSARTKQLLQRGFGARHHGSPCHPAALGGVYGGRARPRACGTSGRRIPFRVTSVP
jgi:hypothetical protein